MSPIPESAEWVRVLTTTGVHVRLVGGNGEVVLSSQPYDDPRSADEAIELARTTETIRPGVVDQRDPNSCTCGIGRGVCLRHPKAD